MKTNKVINGLRLYPARATVSACHGVGAKDGNEYFISGVTYYMLEINYVTGQKTHGIYRQRADVLLYCKY